MIKNIMGILWGILMGFNWLNAQNSTQESMENTGPINTTMIQKSENYVEKRVLKNGMTILVRPSRSVPKVSIQLWYYVGSRDERDRERGIAHLIEHMIFKGTEQLSESDINTATHMLSGSCNAFTSYDYTGYLFNMPTHHWKEVFPVMVDCMLNCKFDDQMLNSEMKAVIQELKMYRDHYVRSLFDQMISTIFMDHPYHHPIIGYKQDLWSVASKDLRAFYKKHYVPNNATLVIVGDVDAQDVFDTAEKWFGAIPADKNYKKETFYFNQDIASKSVTLYRDVKQPFVTLVFVVPGSAEKKDHILHLVEWVLGKGKGSRLHKKLVDELQLVTSLEASSSEELFDYGLLCISFEPKNISDVPVIEQHIGQELEAIAREGITEQEITRAIKQAQMGLYNTLESTEQQAYQIGKYYLATHDENYLFTSFSAPAAELKSEVENIITKYLRAPVMHKGMILPLPEQEKTVWADLQSKSDKEDEHILSARIRTSPVEGPRYAKTLQVKEPNSFAFPKAQSFTLSNGLKVLYYDNQNTPKINIVLSLKARSYYDPEDKQGLYTFVARMMTEGTKKYTAQQLADLIESRGMSLYVYPGGISLSMLSEDLEFGLDILHEIVTSARFDVKDIEKVRAQIIAALKNFWDEPWSFAGQLIKEQLYKKHPYSKNELGTVESVNQITKKDLSDFYKKYISPQETRLAIVGDVRNHNVRNVIERVLGKWQGPKVESIEFPKLEEQQSGIIDHPINRDQIVLLFAALSIDRKHPDYDKLRLFDQIFGSGELGSMSSRLFDLREQSGLFYTINGSLIANADEQSGMVLVKTIVSLDRLKEAEQVIKETIDTAANTITPAEFQEAKHAMINSLVNYFTSNNGIANAFLFLDRFNFPANFFDTRATILGSITIDEMQQAAKKVLQSKRMITLRVGRVKDINKPMEIA